MELKMFNVGFGDCFMFLEADSSLIVDCGTRKFHRYAYDNRNFTSLGDLVDYLYNNIMATKTNNEALLTHFHEDHYKGFELLAKRYGDVFDKVYIPYLCMEDATGRVVLLELAIYLYTFLGKTTMSHLLSKKILKHIEMICTLAKGNNIECLYTGKTVTYCGKRFDVLWPDKEYDPELDDVMEYLEGLHAHIPQLEQFLAIKAEIIQNMREWFGNISGDSPDFKIGSEGIIQIADRQNELLVRLDAYRAGVDGLNEEFNLLRFWYSKVFSEKNNAASIVFHEVLPTELPEKSDTDVTEANLLSEAMSEVAATAPEKIEQGNILMTGDVTPNIIDTYLQLRFCNNYHVLKAPHHGTTGHYSGNLPQVGSILISTGPRTGYTKISEKYRLHSDVGGDRACTSGNAFCLSIDAGLMCRSAHCYNPVKTMGV